MGSTALLLKDISQNDQLPIRIVSPNFGHLSTHTADKHLLTHRLPYYFFLFVLDGSSHYDIDMKKFHIHTHELLFALPNQIQHVPLAAHGKEYYKLGFDEECLFRLPKHYPFLINPLNQQKIRVSSSAAIRLQAIFEILLSLLRTSDTNPDLILAHLNSLLTEINTAYFATRSLSAEEKPTEDKLLKFIEFKGFIETHLTDHPSIGTIAAHLAVSTDSLYQIVKHYSGLAPKEFLTNRLILEARRRIYYHETTSVKELAFDLGFNDPDYFSRLFKKVTGKTIAEFVQDLS